VHHLLEHLRFISQQIFHKVHPFIKYTINFGILITSQLQLQPRPPYPFDLYLRKIYALCSKKPPIEGTQPSS